VRFWPFYRPSSRTQYRNKPPNAFPCLIMLPITHTDTRLAIWCPWLGRRTSCQRLGTGALAVGPSQPRDVGGRDYRGCLFRREGAEYSFRANLNFSIAACISESPTKCHAATAGRGSFKTTMSGDALGINCRNFPNTSCRHSLVRNYSKGNCNQNSLLDG
jgi:hypothetical protein